jgi:tetratricopeptide (TPR) repeat protein
MRMPFIFTLASLLAVVMGGVLPLASADEYEDAQVLLAAQKWSEALPILKKLADEEPESVTIAQDLAHALLRLNRREEALVTLRKYKLNRQADIAARSFLSKESFHFYQQGLDWFMKHSYSQACERFERALEKDQSHLDIVLRQSQCQILDGNSELGLKLLDQFDRIHGKTPETQLWRARALALRGRYEESLLLFSALATGPKPVEPLAELIPLWWGEALLASGQKLSALNVFDNDSKRTPAHLQSALAAIRIRLTQAESTNQLIALDRDLASWEKQFADKTRNRKKVTAEGPFDPIDVEALQRAAVDTKQQIHTRLPSPTPSVR